MSPVTGTNFALGSCEKFQPDFGDEKWPKILGTSSGAKIEKQSRHGETKILTFGPIILALATLKAVSLQLNEMLMKWKIQQEMQDDAIQTVRIHSAFIAVTGLNCSYGKISSSLTENSGTVPACPFICTHRKFYNGLRASSQEPG